MKKNCFKKNYEKRKKIEELKNINLSERYFQKDNFSYIYFLLEF